MEGGRTEAISEISGPDTKAVRDMLAMWVDASDGAVHIQSDADPFFWLVITWRCPRWNKCERRSRNGAAVGIVAGILYGQGLHRDQRAAPSRCVALFEQWQAEAD